MIFRLLSRLSQVYFILFASFALAILQNVTIDDAVLTGPVVPYYLPNNSVWNIGNNCTNCTARPDPSLAYNGTWHDITYYPSNDYSPAIEVSFTGNSLYIFFIIANTVPLPGLPKLTDVYFLLDNVNVSSYIHSPDPTDDYQYNVPVYANSDLDFGSHTMMVQPVLAGNNVLMLFDYLIYSTNVSIETSTSTTSPSPSATATPSSSGSPPSNRGTSSGPHIGAIVGGTVGGGVFLLGASLLCYLIYKRRHGGRASTEEGISLGVLTSTNSVPPRNPYVDSSASTRPPSPDFDSTMKEINERSKQAILSRQSQEALGHSPKKP